jgi:ABC-2 type transport system ATP-binding protein
MDEAERLADDVVIIDRGRVVATGTPSELTRGGRSLEDVFLAVTAAR